MPWDSKDQLVCFERFFVYLDRLADLGTTDREIKELEILCQRGSDSALLRGQAVQDFLDGKIAQDPFAILDPDTQRFHWITNVQLDSMRTNLTFTLGEQLDGQPWADIAQRSMRRERQPKEE